MTTQPWTEKKMPQFPDMKAFVLPGAFYGAVVGLMAEAGFKKASGVEDADVVVFTGGEDINPALYGQKPVATYGVNHDRDRSEEMIYHAAKAERKVLFGICRGAQFLAAKEGAQLYQDVRNHSRSHIIYDIDEDVTVEATSIHHQMVQDGAPGMEVVAICKDQVSETFVDDKGMKVASEENPILEVEAAVFPASKVFFVQGHPEVGEPEYRSWTMTKLQDYMIEWGALPAPKGVEDVPFLQQKVIG